MALDSILLTVGQPAATATVRQAMTIELGAHDSEFVDVVHRVRRQLLDIGGVRGLPYEAVLMEGPSAFAFEAALGSFVPREGGVLVVSNGARGERLA